MEYVRKWFVLTVIMAVFFADAGAFGAATRGGRGVVDAGATTGTIKTDGNSVSSGNQPIAARAASRTRTQPVSTASGANSARVATRTAVKSVASQSTAQSTTQPVPQQQVGSGVVARAGTKQKAVNMGTKITGATENAVIPEECRTAFDGCMDSFCMMANTSGGRCRCDDRSEDLDSVLDQIMKLDQQSKTLAEDGVERLQRGEALDDINAMAEDVANKVVADQKKNQKNFLDTESKNKSKKLDLSVFGSGVFDTDDLFGGLDEDVLQSDLSDKSGSSLHSAATKMCVSKVPAQCKEYSSMLQLVYAQKIKSDCIAYENDLKQQKMNSETLLRTAQKAIRDAASERYQAENKYDRGQCIKEFKVCMTDADKCGTGFANCVVNPALLSTKSNKTQTIKSGSITIEIDSMTYSRLLTFKDQCTSVLNQCVKERDKVWPGFLQSVVAELKSAEIQAESDRLQNCATSVMDCIKRTAKAEGFEEGTVNWDLFTSDPKLFEDICAPELNQCAADNQHLKDSVVAYVKRWLNAKRADTCTTAVRKCYQDKCGGTDYHLCVGLSNSSLRALCMNGEVDNACEGSGKNVAEYVATVGQSLMLEINDEISKTCKNAVNKIMTEECNGTDVCASSAADFSAFWQAYVYYQVCAYNSKNEESACRRNIDTLSDWQMETGKSAGIEYRVKFGSDIRADAFAVKDNNEEGDKSKFVDNWGDKYKNTVSHKAALAKLNSVYDSIMKNIKADSTIQACLSGKQVQNFDGTKFGGLVNLKLDGRQTFPNLLDSVESIVAQGVYKQFVDDYNTRYQEVVDEVAEANARLSTFYSTDATAAQAACIKKFEDKKAASNKKTRYTEVTWFYPATCTDAKRSKGCRIQWYEWKCPEDTDCNPAKPDNWVHVWPKDENDNDRENTKQSSCYIDGTYY